MTGPLDIVTSAALAPLRHGFFARGGGVSTGLYRGLNCGAGSSDLPEAVAANRALVAEAMRVEVSHLATLRQVHGIRVVTLDRPPDGRPEADAAVTRTPGLALGILTADCLPVLLADRDAGVICAAHAGWRGAHAGILEATVAAMEALGATRGGITAVLGPAIGQDAYEVGPEFAARFTATDPASARHFRPGAHDRLHFDLPGYALGRLHALGVGHAEWTGHCTAQDEARFFSYRRSVLRGEPDYGRMIASITL